MQDLPKSKTSWLFKSSQVTPAERAAEYYRNNREYIKEARRHRDQKERHQEMQARIEAALEAERRREARELAELEKSLEDEE